MVKKEEDIIFLLDFDGVLFDTSLEAYYVMNETHEDGSINKNSNKQLEIKMLTIVSKWKRER